MLNPTAQPTPNQDCTSTTILPHPLSWYRATPAEIDTAAATNKRRRRTLTLSSRNLSNVMLGDSFTPGIAGALSVTSASRPTMQTTANKEPKPIHNQAMILIPTSLAIGSVLPALGHV